MNTRYADARKAEVTIVASEVRTEFPPEVVQERREVYARIAALLSEQTYEAAREANALHLDWLRRHPDDYLALDAGEVISKSLSAYACEGKEGAMESSIQEAGIA